MKKNIFVFIYTLLTGCATATIFSDNKNCISTREFEVFQALNDGALAHSCTFVEGCSAFNQLVYLDWDPDIEYYDGLTVKVPSNKCAVQDGVYKYTTKQDIMKTVPIIKFEYKDNAKSEQDVIERLENKYQRMRAACLYDYKASKEKVDEEFCSCYAKQFIKYFININSQENMEYSNETLNKIVKKECGKLPTFLTSN